MEKQKLQWHIFCGRRRLNVKEWLLNKNIKNYDELISWCESQDMIPPTESEISMHFPNLLTIKPSEKQVISVKIEEIVSVPVEEKLQQESTEEDKVIELLKKVAKKPKKIVED